MVVLRDETREMVERKEVNYCCDGERLEKMEISQKKKSAWATLLDAFSAPVWAQYGLGLSQKANKYAK